MKKSTASFATSTGSMSQFASKNERSQTFAPSSLMRMLSKQSSQHSVGAMSEGELREYQEKVMVTWTLLRRFCFSIVTNRIFTSFVFLTIMCNTILLALQTMASLEAEKGWFFAVVDHAFLSVYIFEMVLKLYVFRKDYWRSPWNKFDFVIVTISVAELLILVVVGSLAALDPKIFRLLRIFRTLRAVRALRVLRSVSFLRSLQVIVATVLSSLPAMASILLLLGLIMYIFAIMGVYLYKSVLPDRFSNVLTSMFTLFSLLTLDDWFDLYNDGGDLAPTMIVYLAVFIVFCSFILVNLFVATIVSNLEEQARKTKAEEREFKRKEQMRRTAELGAPSSASEVKLTSGATGDAVAMMKLEMLQEAIAAKKRGIALAAAAADEEVAEEFSVARSQLRDLYLMLLPSLESTLEQGQTLSKIASDLVDMTNGAANKAARSAVAEPAAQPQT